VRCWVISRVGDKTHAEARTDQPEIKGQAFGHGRHIELIQVAAGTDLEFFDPGIYIEKRVDPIAHGIPVDSDIGTKLDDAHKGIRHPVERRLNPEAHLLFLGTNHFAVADGGSINRDAFGGLVEVAQFPGQTEDQAPSQGNDETLLIRLQTPVVALGDSSRCPKQSAQGEHQSEAVVFGSLRQLDSYGPVGD
jgi:hypothetical protein